MRKKRCGSFVVVEADEHAARLCSGFVETIGSVIEDGDHRVGVVLASEACIVLRGEVETLAFKVAWLASVSTRATESPDDGLI